MATNPIGGESANVTFPGEGQQANVVPIRPDVRPVTHSIPPMARGMTLISGPDMSPAKLFDRCYHAAQVAKAEHELLQAKFLEAHWLSEVGAANPFWDERGPAFDRMRAAIVTLAFTPAMDRMQLRMKLQGIGSVWLKAKGRFYDELRYAVAKDEMRLGVKSRRAVIHV